MDRWNGRIVITEEVMPILKDDGHQYFLTETMWGHHADNYFDIPVDIYEHPQCYVYKHPVTDKYHDIVATRVPYSTSDDGIHFKVGDEVNQDIKELSNKLRSSPGIFVLEDPTPTIRQQYKMALLASYKSDYVGNLVDYVSRAADALMREDEEYAKSK